MDSFELSVEAVAAWCVRNQIRYLAANAADELAIPTPLGPNYLIRLVDRPERGMFSAVLTLPIRVSGERRVEATRAAALASGATFMGAWVAHPITGEVYFRVTVGTVGVRYDDEGVRYLLQLVTSTVHTLLPQWRQILEDGAPAETILPRPTAPTPADA